MIEFVITAVLMGILVGFIVVGCAGFVSSVANAEPITDVEVEQAYWLNAYNECRHTLNLKGQTVEHAIKVCNDVANIELEAN